MEEQRLESANLSGETCASQTSGAAEVLLSTSQLHVGMTGGDFFFPQKRRSQKGGHSILSDFVRCSFDQGVSVPC